MNENLAIDGNTKNTLGAVTNDSNAFIRRLRVNPDTGALLCEATITSNNTMIGSTIPGGVAGSVLFIGTGGTLSQDNAEFFWDDAQDFLGLGTDTPDATLHVDGSVEFDIGSDLPGDMYYRDSSGKLFNLPVGTDNQVLTVSSGFPAWQNPGTGTAGYDTIQNTGTPVVQRSVINLTNLLTASDVATKTQLTINTANLGNDSTLISTLTGNSAFLTNIANNTTFVNALIANSAFTTGLANNANFYNALANNTSFISALTSNSMFQSDIVTVINGSGSLSINLMTQVTGILPIANGGTASGTKTGAFNNLSPLSTKGDLLAFNGTNNVRLPAGTNGQVLTANSSATDGFDWETPSNGTINPSSMSYLFEDFTGGGTTSGIIGELGWTIQGGSAISKLPSTATSRGLVKVSADGSGNLSGIQLGSGINEFTILNVPNLVLEYRIQLNVASAQSLIGINGGFGGSFGTGMYFKSVGSVWSGIYSGNSGSTSTSTTVPTTTNFVKLRMVTDGTGANVEYFVDGASLGTLPTDSYTGNVTAGIGVIGTTQFVVGDYFYNTQALTR